MKAQEELLPILLGAKEAREELLLTTCFTEYYYLATRSDGYKVNSGAT